MERERVNHRSTRFMLECQHNHKPKPHLLHKHVCSRSSPVHTVGLLPAWSKGLLLTHASLHRAGPCVGTLRQSAAGEAAPSSQRTEEALGASAGWRARCQTRSSRRPRPTARRAACLGPGRFSRGGGGGGGVGARDAGGEWLGRRPPAPRQGEGAAPGGARRRRRAPAAAAAAADPAPGPEPRWREQTKRRPPRSDRLGR